MIREPGGGQEAQKRTQEGISRETARDSTGWGGLHGGKGDGSMRAWVLAPRSQSHPSPRRHPHHIRNNNDRQLSRMPVSLS
jgi:hypothetical protein